MITKRFFVHRRRFSRRICGMRYKSTFWPKNAHYVNFRSNVIRFRL